jgi:hypothetical protein
MPSNSFRLFQVDSAMLGAKAAFTMYAPDHTEYAITFILSLLGLLCLT